MYYFVRFKSSRKGKGPVVKHADSVKIRMILAVLLAGAVSAFAGRPLVTDDADPVDAGQAEFELGASQERETGFRHWDVPFGLTLGLGRHVEAGFAFGGVFEERTETLEETGSDVRRHENGIGDLNVGVKWQFLPVCPLGARHALAASVKFPTADEDKELGSGKTDADLYWIISRNLGETAGAHLQIGYTWIGGPDDDVLHAGLALDVQLTDVLQGVGEVFAEKELTDGADAIWQYTLGLRWAATETLTLDVAAGSKLGSDGPDFAGTAGFTWAFGFKTR